MGRTKTYEAIIKGKPIPEPSVGESFRVLTHELQALALDVKVFDHDGNVIDISASEEDVKNAPAQETVFEVADGGFAVTDDSGNELPPEAAVAGIDDFGYDM